MAAKSLARAGDPGMAAEVLETVLEDEEGPDERKDIFMNLARLYIESGLRYDKALDVLKRASEEFPPLEMETPIRIALAFGGVGLEALDPIAARQKLNVPRQVERLAKGLLAHSIQGYERLRPGAQESLQNAAIYLFGGEYPRPLVSPNPQNRPLRNV
jgi:hypothetical protein